MIRNQFNVQGLTWLVARINWFVHAYHSKQYYFFNHL